MNELLSVERREGVGRNAYQRITGQKRSRARLRTERRNSTSCVCVFRGGIVIRVIAHRIGFTGLWKPCRVTFDSTFVRKVANFSIMLVSRKTLKKLTLNVSVEHVSQKILSLTLHHLSFEIFRQITFQIVTLPIPYFRLTIIRVKVHERDTTMTMRAHARNV